MSRWLVLALAPAWLASTAHAQAPGDVAPEPAYAGPSAMPVGGAPYAPQVVVVPGRPSVMHHRVGVGVSLGGFAVAPSGASSGAASDFRVGELALRYRASLRLELELAMSGGRQVLPDGLDGQLAAGSVTFALRYRFMPEHRWNWFLIGGLGGTVIAPHDSNEQQREDHTRPLAMFGVGLERRFHRFALQAELRTIAIGPRPISPEVTPLPVPAMPRPGDLLPGSSTLNADQLGGGMFTLGASYYF